jgi:hypothetical protein
VSPVTGVMLSYEATTVREQISAETQTNVVQSHTSALTMPERSSGQVTIGTQVQGLSSNDIMKIPHPHRQWKRSH